MNKLEAEALGIKVITLEDDAFYRETYKEITISYIKGDDTIIYAINPDKKQGIKFCLSADNLETLKNKVKEAIDYYRSIDWAEIEAKKHPQ